MLVLVDLGARFRFIDVDYTDLRVLPRAEALRHWMAPAPAFSLHQISGTYSFQLLLFILAGCFAVMLLVDYRSRLATVGAWLLLLSLQHRNYYVLDAGDVLLRMLLFWSIFLPCGARYSIDGLRCRESSTGPTVFCSATLAIGLQFIFVYTFAGLAKFGPRGGRKEPRSRWP